MKLSRGESLCRDLLKLWFPSKNVIYNYRPIWLKNPETGHNLELDIFYPDLKLAVEFNGVQHKLLLQRRKDYFKKQQCDKLGVLMISVYDPMNLFKCKVLIRKHTGIRVISGRTNMDLLCQLKLYSKIEGAEPSWYKKSKEESDNADQVRIRNKSFRRTFKIELRRNLRLL